MAPIELDTSISNFQPLFLLGSYLFATGTLTTLILRNVIYRAYRALPPSQTTRYRQSKRRNHVQIFAALSMLSLAMTTYYVYSSFSLSYRVWAHERGEMLPNGLWGPGGVVGGGDGTVGLELGRWFKDTSLLLDHWEIIVEKSRRFWWSQQMMLGSTILALFMGIEGRRRNIPHLWAFLTLGRVVSIAFAQSLFFLAILVTPLPLPEGVDSPTRHRPRTRSNAKSGVLAKAGNAVKKSTASTEHAVHHSWHKVINIADRYIPSKPSTWTPHPLVYILPLVITHLAIFLVPFASHTPSFSTTILMSLLTPYLPLYIDRLTPHSWGTPHTNPHSARQACLPIFKFISFASITFHLKQTLLALLDNEPGSHHHRHSSLFSHRDQHLTTIERTSTAIGRVLGSVADHPAVANVAWDVMLCGLGLVLWATIRGLDVSDILAAVGMSRLGKAVTHHVAAAGEAVGEKMVDVKDQAKELVNDLVDASVSSPKRSRGRPRKTTTGVMGPPSPRKRAVKVDSDNGEDDVYVPPRGLDVQVGTEGEEEPEEDVEAGVLGWGNKAEKLVVIKSVLGHPRVANERDVLKRFQHRTPYIRPMIDEIEEPDSPPTIVLRYLDDHLQNASTKGTLNEKSSNVKLDNVFVNYGDGDVRFSDVQLGDLGGSYPAESKWAREGTPVGAPMWSSPAVIMETPWNIATDIWSFGTVLISLIYGGSFNLFRPATVPYDHEEYGLEILKRQFRYFGPFLPNYQEIASKATVLAILYLMQEIPQSQTTPFRRVTEREVCRADKNFIVKIMKMDWRDRPTAKALLEDEWFEVKGEE